MYTLVMACKANSLCCLLSMARDKVAFIREAYLFGASQSDRIALKYKKSFVRRQQVYVHGFSCCYVGFLLCYSKQRQLDIALRKIEMFSVEVK